MVDGIWIGRQWDIVRQVTLVAHNCLENIEDLVELFVLVLSMPHLKFEWRKYYVFMHLLNLVKLGDVSAYESL